MWLLKECEFDRLFHKTLGSGEEAQRVQVKGTVPYFERPISTLSYFEKVKRGKNPLVRSNFCPSLIQNVAESSLLSECLISGAILP